jgi:hypothetical protein
MACGTAGARPDSEGCLGGIVMAPSPAGAGRSGIDDRAAAFARWWVHTYTRGIDPAVADIRQHEIASDVWEQQALGRRVGAPPSAVAGSIVRRVIAGMPADLLWSHSARRVPRGEPNTLERTPMSTLRTMWLPTLAGLLGLFQILAGTEMLLNDPKLENAIALTVFGGLGLTALVGVWLRQRRRTVSDALIMLGVLPSFVIYIWWWAPPLLAAVVVIAATFDLAETKAMHGRSAPNHTPLPD